MTLVVAARERLTQAEKDAKSLIDEARAAFGLSIVTARKRDGLEQAAIAKQLKLTREQVRRYERYYDDWKAKHGREPAAP